MDNTIMNPSGKEVELIKNSGLLDPSWYEFEYPDVAALGIEPAEHYLKFGARLLRDPGPEFRTRDYLQAYPDVAEAGVNPLVHYLIHGRSEGREHWRARADAGNEAAAAHGTCRGQVIRSAKQGALPDLFTLRTVETASQTVIVSFETSPADSRTVEKAIFAFDEDFDHIRLFPAKRLDIAPGDPSGRRRRIVSVGYPDGFGEAASFVHLVASGALTRYQHVVWLRDEDSNSAAIERLRPQSMDTRAGLLASELARIEIKLQPEVSRLIGTLLPRLGRKLSEGHVVAPAGPVVCINPLLLRQLAAFELRPQDLIARPDDSAPWGRTAIDCMLGILAREGMLSVGTLSDEQPAKTQDRPSVAGKRRKVKTIAFYLPQFHPVPDNDRWWGKGFTEWTNVTRAKPLFRSHHQPRLPADLGFYDLRLPAAQQAQADLADKFGVHGFCYYYYWFDGKKMLNEPIEQMLRSGKPDFPFCVCWANENWSRNWDGQNRHVLLEQSYSIDSNRALIREFIPMMKDGRYIRHHGKPVLIVYRIRVIPNWLETAEMWREECRKAGIGEIHLCAVRFGLEPLDGQPQQYGLDSYVLFPPHETVRKDVRGEVHDLHRNFGGELLSYDAVIDGDLERFSKGYSWPVHRGAMMGWDNTARRLTDSRIFKGATPLRFRAWLSGILKQEQEFNTDDESLLFINAWNEWAEGTTLEPDQKFGTGYLEATQSALAGYDVEPPRSTKVTAGQRPVSLVAAHVPTGDAPKPLPVPTRIPGMRPRKADVPTVMLCAHISGHQLFGGERSFLDVLEAMKSMPLNVVVTLPSLNNKEYVAEVSSRSVALYGFPYPQWMNNRPIDPSLCLLFGDIIASEKVDVVHANTIVLMEPLVAAKRMGRTALVHARELISLDESLRERMGLSSQEIIKEVFHRSDYVIANSHATANTFARQGRTFYVPNAVDVEAMDITNPVNGKIRFGIVSSNIPKKGVADFVTVAAACHERAPNAEFIVIGPKNDQTNAWETELKEGRRPLNLKFIGYRKSPREAMAEINVLLNLSSFAESFGRTVAEALAARRPVITYEWGALPELVEHGETGYLAPYRDTNAVVDHVLRICAEPRLIEAMGSRGRIVMSESFSNACLRRQLAAAYQKVLGRDMSQPTFEAPGAVSDDRKCVTIVVPVFNAHDVVAKCLSSIRQHTTFDGVRVLVINDGSSDPRIGPLLQGYREVKGFSILHNETNLGYTKTVNRGIRESGTDDVVLLNSDAIVTPQWLAGLRIAAYADPKSGTVTAMSDNAGAFSFPVQGERTTIPEGMTAEVFAHRVVSETSSCVPVEVPTGSGFCMYIRRQVMDIVGLFDEEAFPRGYGEENDFCMRVLNAGWKNLVSPWSFVFHIRTASFGSEKAQLVKAGVDVVTRRYPDYALRVKTAFSSNEMKSLRRAASKAIENARGA